jgi:tRNA(fMet)-specific endonuclease VapC
MCDTDIVSYIMKRSRPEPLRRLAMTSVGDVCISAVTKAELLFGVMTSPCQQRDEASLNDFLRHVTVLDFPEEAALDYAEIRADLKRKGTPIGANDLFIAAHARSQDLILVTNNMREYARVPNLRLENWATPRT